MKLDKGEYTTQGFLEFLNKEYGEKLSGKKFSSNDLAQYLIRGYTPYRYGHLMISSKIQEGVRIITTEKKEKK